MVSMISNNTTNHYGNGFTFEMSPISLLVTTTNFVINQKFSTKEKAEKYLETYLSNYMSYNYYSIITIYDNITDLREIRAYELPLR